jgi:Domain of unknown function (DUF4346)
MFALEVEPTVNLSLGNVDEVLSQRELDLDPAGYFIIYLNDELICAKHYTTVIDERGLACDPETGKPLPAKTAVPRTECILTTGRTAKELCVKLFEQNNLALMPMHAAYLGREFMRAEFCLRHGLEFIQD